MEKKGIYTTREAADVLGVSLRTIQLWVESGKLSAWKTEGGHRRIIADSVEALLHKHEAALSSSRGQPTLNLVLIEDEVDTLEFYRLHIEAMGLPIKVHTADNGFNGLLQIGAHKPDILVTDLIMPHLDGFQLIRTLRNNPDYRHINTIVVTALTDTQIINRGGLPGSVSVLNKPFDFDVLNQKLIKILNDKQSLRMV